MDANTLLFELGKIADKLDIELRFDDLETAGGLCTIKGKRLLCVSRHLPPEEKAEIILNEIARLSGIEDMYILPEVRKLLDERS